MGRKYLGRIFSVVAGLVLLLAASLGWVYGAAVDSGDYTKAGLIRLHVLANSDTEVDQVLKRKVRDAVLEYMTPYMQTSTDKISAEKIILEHMPAIRSIALQVVLASGYNYPVDVVLGDHQFPTKTYGSLSLPAGNYQALRILIGKAEGQNWWCVLFPPLCFVDVTSGTAVAQQTQKTLDDINNQQMPILRFKILELFQKNS
jgi:stage II sporulation protein R